jgi:hypothetical protein
MHQQQQQQQQVACHLRTSATVLLAQKQHCKAAVDSFVDGGWHPEHTCMLLPCYAGFLPTGWEMGYNHYVGRLGMRLPETAAMLARSWPEWQVKQCICCGFCG